MSIDLSFWNKKSVLITGHTGFKGTWLSKILLKLGAKVSGFSLKPESDPNIFHISGLAEKLSYHLIGDIRNTVDLERAFLKVKPDVLFHMAAQPIISLGYEQPLETFDTNIMGTAKVLNQARNMKAGAPIIVISSDKCYQNDNLDYAFVETDHLGGADPYSASKAGTEIIAKAYQSSYFSKEGSPRLATARAGNVIGGGDWAKDRLIPDLARAYSNNTSISLRMPKATRPWQFVTEPLFGYLLLAQAVNKDPTFQSAWNFGPNETANKNVLDIASAICEYWPNAPEINIVTDGKMQKEAKILAVDAKKALKKLNWEPQLSINETIKWTADWYRAFIKGDSSANLMVDEQIKNYLNRFNFSNE